MRDTSKWSGIKELSKVRLCDEGWGGFDSGKGAWGVFAIGKDGLYAQVGVLAKKKGESNRSLYARAIKLV